MPLPVEIEGKKYFATLPALSDFSTFKDHLRREHRREGYAAIPEGLSEAEHRRWMRMIDAECTSIDPFESFERLAKSGAKGLALIFHAMLRHENSGTTLEFVAGLLERAESGRAESVAGVRQLCQAMGELLAAKKNEVDQLRAEQARQAEQPIPSTSTESTSPSPPATD